MTLSTENRPQGVSSMPFDTVKLRSPTILEESAQRIENLSIRRIADDLARGVRLYEFTKGQLAGSWDSRIGFQVMRSEFVYVPGQRPAKVACPPYLIVECSLAKVLFGQNIYGGPTDLSESVGDLMTLLGDAFGVVLPAPGLWIVRRIDWAETFALPFSGIQEYIRHIQTISFPRRRAHKYGDQGLYFPGSTTTVKLYHKGPEFAKHDAPRLRRLLRGAESASREDTLRRVRALQRLANNRLRAEVEIHADKLDFDFGHAPRVREISPEYPRQVFDVEMRKLVREGSSEQSVVRTTLSVGDRLRAHYGKTHGNRLLGFWCLLAASGEAECRATNPVSTFYRYRKQLQAAGVSWLNTDLQLCGSRNGLPSDFAPIRSDPRLCNRPARERWRINHLSPAVSAHF